MANVIRMLFYLIFIGALVINVIPYNPLLTYTIRFKQVKANPNISVDYFNIDQYRDTQFINGQFKINSKELVNKVIAIFYRCDADGINCEYFQTWKLTDLCSKLKDKNQVWSRWYGSFDPPMVCPLDKVKYQIKNGTFDIGPILLLYPQATDYQWKLLQKLYNDDILIGSYMIELYFFSYRKKLNSIIKL